MIVAAIVSVLLCSVYCSAQTVPAPPKIPLPDDKINWGDVWKVLNSGGMSRTDDPHLTVFDTILRINAKERGNAGAGRSDSNIFLFEGDIEMDKKEVEALVLQGSQGTSRRKRAVMKKRGSNLWQKNVAYAMDGRLGSRARTVVQSAVREWQATLPCMGTWRDVSSTSKPRNYMYFFQGGGCYSQVGRVGGGQRVSIGRGCEYHGIAVHEIGHAMGLWHEQSRPDRDGYVTIHWNNIIPAMKFNFQKHSTSRVDSLGVGYDYTSVMHYGATAFARARGLRTISSRRGGQTLGQRRGLSAYDKKQVRLLYGCTTTVKPTKPTTCQKSASHNTWCAESKKLGLCVNSLFKNYMTAHCCSTCRPKPSGCVDKLPDKTCKGWRSSGYCGAQSQYAVYMKKNCCKTCSCKDKNSRCSTWKKFCPRSSKHSAYMLKNCQATCGVC